MTNKFILFPEKYYRSLIAPTNQQEGKGITDDLNEMSGLEYAKKKLHQIQKKKRKNLKNMSTKNILYNQRLRSYLRMRKQIKDKPIGVSFGDEGPKAIAKGIQKAFLDENGELIPLLIPEYQVPKEPDSAFEVSGTPLSGSYASYSQSPKSRKSSSSVSDTATLEPPKQLTQEIEESTLLAPSSARITPITTRSKGLAPEAESKGILTEKVEKLLDLILQNRKKFGITRFGEIINPTTNKPFNNSSLEQSIVRIVNPLTTNAPTPPGTKRIKHLILSDTEGSKILYEQYGTGKFQEILQRNKLHPVKFIPLKWKTLTNAIK